MICQESRELTIANLHDIFGIRQEETLSFPNPEALGVLLNLLRAIHVETGDAVADVVYQENMACVSVIYTFNAEL